MCLPASQAASRTSSSVAVSGRSVPKEAMPHSAQAFFLLRTYVSESCKANRSALRSACANEALGEPRALRAPTSTTARPGTCGASRKRGAGQGAPPLCRTFPVFAFIAATFSATSLRTVSAIALPSMMCAPARGGKARWREVVRGLLRHARRLSYASAALRARSWSLVCGMRGSRSQEGPGAHLQRWLQPLW